MSDLTETLMMNRIKLIKRKLKEEDPHKNLPKNGYFLRKEVGLKIVATYDPEKDPKYALGHNPYP